MALKYLKTQQIVPDKGMSFTLYEIEGENTILRMLTTIPESGMLKCYPKPPVKTLFAPERCGASSEEEFLDLWERGQSGT